jgi:hypothetical protein
MFPHNVTALRADALFASALQRSDELSPGQIRRAVAVALDVHGVAGCDGRMAQKFGDHPETAKASMSWRRNRIPRPGGYRSSTTSGRSVSTSWTTSRPE